MATINSRLRRIARVIGCTPDEAFSLALKVGLAKPARRAALVTNAKRRFARRARRAA